jgi:hypothetical protein
MMDILPVYHQPLSYYSNEITLGHNEKIGNHAYRAIHPPHMVVVPRLIPPGFTTAGGLLTHSTDIERPHYAKRANADHNSLVGSTRTTTYKKSGNSLGSK